MAADSTGKMSHSNEKCPFSQAQTLARIYKNQAWNPALQTWNPLRFVSPVSVAVPIGSLPFGSQPPLLSAHYLYRLLVLHPTKAISPFHTYTKTLNLGQSRAPGDVRRFRPGLGQLPDGGRGGAAPARGIDRRNIASLLAAGSFDFIFFSHLTFCAPSSSSFLLPLPNPTIPSCGCDSATHEDAVPLLPPEQGTSDQTKNRGARNIFGMDSAAPGGRWWRGKKLGSRDYGLHERANFESAVEVTSNGSGNGGAAGSLNEGASVEYRTYKRRWFGLAQLTLMNIIVSWDWLTFAPVASHAATYYSVPESTINWISTAFFLAFVAVFPVSIAILHRGPKLAFMTAAVLMLVGNWVRYAGSSRRSGGSVVAAMVGEIIIGFAQPFILAAPTRYSDLWFTNRGRVAATALTSLANPFGAALGQLITPFWVSDSGDISSMVLYISIISTVCCVPAFFVPAKPPTPVGPAAETPKLSLRESLAVLTSSLELWLILIPFAVYVGFFNSISTLLNQMMKPYGFTDDEAGIAGAILIVVGLVASAVTSPIIDRTKTFLLAIKVAVPLIGLCYLIFVWMPQTRVLAGPYVLLAFLGASSFSLVPVALEYLIELSHPLSPEVTSTIAWAGGQLFGAIFTIICDALAAGPDASPPKNMKKALIFQAIVALAVVPLPLCLGLFGREDKVALKRVRSDEEDRPRTVVSTDV
ncbi:hypothetical protein G7046_g5607 [Stylonectria norvegica]|nr:hypothetical protein G7046_g5607 [Stylonectria norvegica]